MMVEQSMRNEVSYSGSGAWSGGKPQMALEQAAGMEKSRCVARVCSLTPSSVGSRWVR